eukprot:721787-Prorocentrum_minimum.AAC.4
MARHTTRRPLTQILLAMIFRVYPVLARPPTQSSVGVSSLSGSAWVYPVYQGGVYPSRSLSPGLNSNYRA